MTELKTLKDIEHKSENAYPFIDQFKYILKQEAINWVKEMNKLETADDMNIIGNSVRIVYELLKEKNKGEKLEWYNVRNVLIV